MPSEDELLEVCAELETMRGQEVWSPDAPTITRFAHCAYAIMDGYRELLAERDRPGVKP